MAQAGEDPALDHEHRHLDLGLVARLAHPGRQDRRAVVRRHVEIGPVQPRLVPVRPIDPDLRVVGHELGGNAAHEGQRTGMGADPIRERLRPGGLGVGVAGGAHRRDEHLRLMQLAGPPVDDLDRLPGIVDEQTLAGRVRLAHGRRQPALPGAVELAPAAVAVAAGLGGAILLPEQHERDAGATQLAMHLRPVRLALPTTALPAAVAGVEQGFQHAVAQRLRQRPCQARRRHAIERQRHRAARDAQRARHRPVGGAALVLEAQDLPLHPRQRHH